MYARYLGKWDIKNSRACFYGPSVHFNITVIGHLCTMLLCVVYNITGAAVPATISSHCCSIPFTLNGNLHYSCTDDGSGLGCFYGDRQWKLCRQPAGEFPVLLSASKRLLMTTTLSSVLLPMLRRLCHRGRTT